MKKIITVLMAAFFMIPITTSAADSAMSQKMVKKTDKNICSNVNANWLRIHIPLPSGSKIIHKEERSGLCEVILDVNNRLATIYAGKDNVIVGRMFSRKKRISEDMMKKFEPVAKKFREEAKMRKLAIIKKNFNVIKNMVFTTYSPSEKAEKTVYVVTDPRCGYCKKALKFLKNTAKVKNFKIAVITYPLLGEKSLFLANEAITENYTMDQYLAPEWLSKDFSKKKKSDRFLKIKSLGDKFFPVFHFRSVPVILGDDASFIVSGADIPEIQKEIDNMLK